MTSTTTTTTTTGPNPPSLHLLPDSSSPPGQIIPLHSHPQLIDLSNVILSDATPPDAPTSAVARRLLSEAVQILSLAGRSLHLVNVAIDANAQVDSLSTGGTQAGGWGTEKPVEKNTNATTILSQIINNNNNKVEQGNLVNEGSDIPAAPPGVQSASNEAEESRKREQRARVIDDNVDDDDSSEEEEDVEDKLTSFWKGYIRAPEDTYEGVASGSDSGVDITCHRKNCQAEGSENDITFGIAADGELNPDTEAESTPENSWSNILLWERETLLSLLDGVNMDMTDLSSSKSSPESSSSPFAFLSPQLGNDKSHGSKELQVQQLQHKLELLQTELIERERRLVIDLVQVDDVRKIMMEQMDVLAEKQRDLDIREGDILEREIMGMEESLTEKKAPAPSTGKKATVEDYYSDDEPRPGAWFVEEESVPREQKEPDNSSQKDFVPKKQRGPGNPSYRERRLSIEEDRVKRLEARLKENEKRIKDREETLKDQEERMKEREAGINEFINKVLVQRAATAEEMTIIGEDTNMVEEGLLARYERARKDNAWSTLFPKNCEASSQEGSLHHRQVAVNKREENLDIREVTLAYEQHKAMSFKKRLKQREQRIAEMEKKLLRKILAVKEKDSIVQRREIAVEIHEKKQQDQQKIGPEISTSSTSISSSDPSTFEQREELLRAREQALDKADRWIQEQQLAITKAKANIMTQEHRAREITEGFYRMEDTLDSREQNIHRRERSFQWREKMQHKYGRPWPERRELEAKEIEARLEKKLRIEIEANIRDKIKHEGCKCKCAELGFDSFDGRLAWGTTASANKNTTTCTCCGMKKRTPIAQYNPADPLGNFFRDFMLGKGENGLLG